MTKSQKSMNAKKRAVGKFEKQLSTKFKDLGERLETDKEELNTRLAKLTQKVAKI